VSSDFGEAHDWDIDANGFYIATRGFLVRRGYCCANQCRNCPYINWRDQPTWKPAPVEAVQFTTVAAKALQAAQQRLAFHEQQLRQANETERDYHRTMAEHYRVLVERWQV
jgi:Family of unknown function (DUF5522)